MSKAPTLTQRIVIFLRKFRNFVLSKRIIPLFKGTLAYTLVIVLVFIAQFNSLTVWPANFQNALIPTIVAATGQPIGACIQGSALVLLGIAVGSVHFAIMASLAKWTVVQAIIFALIVYILSWFKAGDARLFIVFLLGILMGFDGIMNSVNNDNTFLPLFLLADAASSLFGLAVAIAVNLLVFPTTSEKELRQMLVTSLSHIEELSGLVAKAYAMIAMESEMEKGEVMMQIMRADFVALNRILEDTAVEINWSVYSMEDYRNMIQHTLGLQRCMFRGFNALALFSLQDKQILSRVVIPSTRHLVFRIRTDISKIIHEISEELGGKGHGNPPMRAGYEELVSVERDAAKLRRQFVGRQPGKTNIDSSHEDGEEDEKRHDGEVPADVEKNLASLSQDFLKEVDPTDPERHVTPSSPDVEKEAGIDIGFLPEPIDPTNSIQRLQRDFLAIQKVQADIMHSILTVVHPQEGEEQMGLRMEERLPSLREKWGIHHRRGDVRIVEPTTSPRKSVSRTRKRTSTSKARDQTEVIGTAEEDRGRQIKRSTPSVGLQEDQTDVVESSDLVKLSRALATVYSLHFSTQTVIEELSELCNVIRPHFRSKRSKKFHIHLFPTRSQHPTRSHTSARASSMMTRGEVDEQQLSVKEAMAILENKPFVPTEVTFWQRVDSINQFFKTDQSMYAIKAAAISTVFAVLFYAPVTRGWFNSFAMQASLLAALVAFEPTIGQSVIMFVTQVLGSGLGTLAGLAILEIFRDVGGYPFNPYGISVFAAIFSFPIQYFIYEKPKFFVFGLLALASAGSIIVHEAVLVNYAQIPFDSPPLQAGKAFATLAIALALVLVFQMLILRTPARRTLRIAMGNLMYSTLAYMTMNQAYVQAIIPTDANLVAPIAAVRRVERELVKREAEIIGDMLGISSLVVAAAAEPSSVAWRPHIPNRLLQANGLLMDRLQEARIALGHEPFDPFILKNFIGVLSPYRHQAHRTFKTSLYLSATSLLSKSPLPYVTINVGEHLQDFIEDAVIVSARLAATEEGAKAIKEDSFTRFWFYILCVGDIPRHLRELESVCKDMFGNLEDDPKLK